MQLSAYIHRKDTNLANNFKDVAYDYTKYRTNVYHKDNELYRDLLYRLDHSNQDSQTKGDRIWLVKWIFETIGTYDIVYLFKENIIDELYELSNND